MQCLAGHRRQHLNEKPYYVLLPKVQRTKTDYRRRDERLGERAAAHNTDRGKTMHASLLPSFNSTSFIPSAHVITCCCFVDAKMIMEFYQTMDNEKKFPTTTTNLNLNLMLNKANNNYAQK
jgi:hypothetical protein